MWIRLIGYWVPQLVSQSNYWAFSPLGDSSYDCEGSVSESCSGPFDYKSEKEIEKGFKVAEKDAARDEDRKSKVCV